MRAKAVVTFLVVLFAWPLAAQIDTVGANNLLCTHTQRQARWDFGAGAKFSFLDFEEMNSALEANGLPGLESPVPCLALAARTSFAWNRWLVESGVEFSFGSSNKNQPAQRQSVTFRDYGLHTRVMYDAFRRNRFSKIFPYAGLGVSCEVLSTSTASFEGENVGPLPAQSLERRRFTYVPVICEIGLSLEQGIKVRNRDVFVGLRGGYAFRFLQTNWGLGDNLAVDLPKPAPGTPYMAMMLRIKTHPKQQPGLARHLR